MSLAALRVAQAVGSVCDLRLGQAELYLDTGARASFWAGEGGRARGGAPGGPPHLGDGPCVRSCHPDRALLAPTAPKKAKERFCLNKGGSLARFVCGVCL